MARVSFIAVCILLIVSLFLVGSGAREQVDARLGATLTQDLGLADRMVGWKDSIGMVRDFPLFGVGLGAWGDLYFRYQQGPWSADYFREAHNDYVEVLGETGLVGFGLLAWFFIVGGKRIVQSTRKVSSKNLPLIAGILAGLGGMAVHEWLDFSLQIPSNAFLFTVLLAVGLRLAGSRERGAGSTEQEAFQHSGIPAFQQHDLEPQWSEVRDQMSEV